MEHRPTAQRTGRRKTSNVKRGSAEAGVGCAFTLEYVYDTVNRLKEIHDAPALGNKIVYTYDTEGNQIREEYRDSSGVGQRYSNFEYDNFNEVITREQYDGDTVSVVDANGDGVPDKPSAGLLRARSTAAMPPARETDPNPPFPCQALPGREASRSSAWSNPSDVREA